MTLKIIHAVGKHGAAALVLALTLSMPPLTPALDAAESDPAHTNSTPSTLTNALVASTPAAPQASTNDNSGATVTNSPSAATNSPSGPTFATALDFPSFRIIADRNIFNPNRTSRSSRGGGGGRGGGSEPRPVRIETFSLVGTMSYGSNQMAFFDSSTARYRKAMKSGDTIADHKILAVTVQGIRLEKDGKQLEMPMGSQMRREDDAPWELKVAASPVPRSPTSSTSSNDSSGSSSSSAADNDVLKRLLQKREQELNK